MKGFYDIHCHIIPGVDDGSSSLKQTARMLEAEYDDGVRTIILTPHFRPQMFETDMKTIVRAYQQTDDLAWDLADDLEVCLGCEFYANHDITRLLQQGLRPSMADTRYVLVEFSTGCGYSQIRSQIRELLHCGYWPIIAHAERYDCLRRTPSYIEEIISDGALIQVNAGSILGEDGWLIRRFCLKLIKQNLIHFIASDAHNLTTRKPNLGACAAFLEKKFGSDYVEEILIQNPEYLLANQRIQYQ